MPVRLAITRADGRVERRSFRSTSGSPGTRHHTVSIATRADDHADRDRSGAGLSGHRPIEQPVDQSRSAIEQRDRAGRLSLTALLAYLRLPDCCITRRPDRSWTASICRSTRRGHLVFSPVRRVHAIPGRNPVSAHHADGVRRRTSCERKRSPRRIGGARGGSRRTSGISPSTCATHAQPGSTARRRRRARLGLHPQADYGWLTQRSGHRPPRLGRRRARSTSSPSEAASSL